MSVNLGRFGPYVKHNNNFVSIKDYDPSVINLEESINLILKKENKMLKNILVFLIRKPIIEVLNGRYGPYIKSEKKNYKIPKGSDPKKLSREDCLDLIKKSKNNLIIYLDLLYVFKLF